MTSANDVGRMTSGTRAGPKDHAMNTNQTPRISVLVADDDNATRMVLRTLLQNAGCEVIGEAASGQQAVQKCSALKPDVVFLDIDMPPLNGFEAMREIRAAQPQTGIVMVSALATLDNVRQAMNAGAGGF